MRPWKTFCAGLVVETAVLAVVGLILGRVVYLDDAPERPLGSTTGKSQPSTPRLRPAETTVRPTSPLASATREPSELPDSGDITPSKQDPIPKKTESIRIERTAAQHLPRPLETRPVGPRVEEVAVASPSEELKVQRTLVVDLSRKNTHTTLSELASARRLRVKVLEVTDAPLPYQLDPQHGVVQIGQPVDIVFAHAWELRIHLSMTTRADMVELKVSPQIGSGQGSTMDFTQRRVQRAYRSFVEQAAEFGQRLAAAKVKYHNIRVWLEAPVVKELEMRGKAKLELGLLERQIRAAEQQMDRARARAADLRQLAELANRIHDMTTIRVEWPQADAI